MDDLTQLTLAQAMDGLLCKRFTAVELVDQHISRMESARKLNAFVYETPDKARDMARASDIRLQKGKAGKLEGLPFGIKDMFCTENIPTTACSKILSNFIPPYESTVTENLWRAGAVHLGKLNNDEFAMGSSNETSYFDAVINPWKRENDDTQLVAGGSSGGSSAAIAAHLGVAATATDTGGSVRQPASYTGTVGLKPTYGRCSRWGIIAFASSLDQASVITRNVEDAAIVLGIMAGYDSKDSTSVDLPVPNYEQNLVEPLKNLRVGIPREYRIDDLPVAIDALWQQGIEWYKDLGAEIVDISLPHIEYALATYYIIAPAEASSNLARYDGVRYGIRVEDDDITDMYQKTREQGFGKEVIRRVIAGTYVLSAGYYDAYYLKAQKVRRLIANDFMEAYKKCDVLLTPTAPSGAFAINEKMQDILSMYLNDIFTVPINLAGLPAISVPVGLDKQSLPIGLQLIAAPFKEHVLLRAAYMMEQAAKFTTRPKDWWMHNGKK